MNEKRRSESETGEKKKKKGRLICSRAARRKRPQCRPWLQTAVEYPANCRERGWRTGEGEKVRFPFEILEGAHPVTRPSFSGSTESIIHEAQTVSQRAPRCRPASAALSRFCGDSERRVTQ